MRNVRFTLAAALVATSCSLPWNTSPNERELNVGFKLQNNQVKLTSVTLAGHTGDVLLATASRRTIVDPQFAASAELPKRNVDLRFGQRHRIVVKPETMPLHGLADATIGADAFAHESVTIDYAKELVILRPVPDTSQMPQYPYSGAPSVPIVLNGVPLRAVIDTLVPDTMIIPPSIGGRDSGRVNVSLSVGGIAFPVVNARIGNVQDVHLGNRVLANFLVTVDYPRNTVALWRDPRSSSATAMDSVR